MMSEGQVEGLPKVEQILSQTTIRNRRVRFALVLKGSESNSRCPALYRAEFRDGHLRGLIHISSFEC